MSLRRLLLPLLAAGACVWTGAGETSDPLLDLADLPADVVADCRLSAADDCHTVLQRHWLGRNSQGELFLVWRSDCQPSCNAWLVQRSTNQARTLLALTGEFRLQRAAGGYPAVQVRTETSTTSVRYAHYAWNGDSYARTQTREVHQVDGVECGSAEECAVAAAAALNDQQTDRAVRIYEQVHGIGWI